MYIRYEHDSIWFISTVCTELYFFTALKYKYLSDYIRVTQCSVLESVEH